MTGRRRTLADWLAHAERLHPVGIDLGLARVRRVAERLDVLPPSPLNIVIAGTNGKGSTSVYLEALLRASGRRVGATLSPHLHRFNERIRVDGRAVEDDVICDAFETIEAARADTTLTYFEFGILAALLTFKRARVGATVLEVGLGGRLDAVNLVDGNVTIITSIGIDHVGYLGPDRESIGAEKAGILRRGVACVYGETSIPASIVAAARALDAPVLQYGTAFAAHRTDGTWTFEGRRLGQPVVHAGLARPAVALNNAATALQAFVLVDPSCPVPDAVRFAQDACLPGRFERFVHRNVPVIVDVAHNPHGATFLAAQLGASRAKGGRTFAIAGFLQDKDAAGIVAALDDQVDHWTFIGTEGSRGQSATSIAESVKTRHEHTVAERPLPALIDDVCARLRADDRVVVLGSFDVAQRARAALMAGAHDVD